MKQKRWDYYFDILYRLTLRFALTNRYVNKVRNTLSRLCPMEKQHLCKRTMQICLTTWGMMCLVFYLLFCRRPGIYSFALSCFFSVVISGEALRFTSKRLERRILRQMDKLLNDVRHFYYDTHSIRTALQAAAGFAGMEMRIHIDILLEVLGAENIEMAVEDYYRTTSNRFMKLFLSQCVAIQEYGDTERNGESVFVRNLSDLREDILNYLLQLDHLQLEFGGLTFITLVPILTLSVIRSTAIATLPELDRFYSGTSGIILPVVYLVGTILVYSVILEMQELDVQNQSVYRILQRLGKCKWISNMLDCWERRHYGNVIGKKRKLQKAGESIVPRYFFLEKMLSFVLTAVTGAGILVYAKGSDKCIQWWELCVLVLIGIIAYQIPEIRLKYRTALMQMNMLSEVTQFQSIIMMQMFIPDITVLRILLTMEQFAMIFRKSIQDCINEYSYSVFDALSNMKASESFEPFRRLCDNLMTVDKIGVIHSFEEIVQDREHFQRQREADTYRMIRKKSGQAKLIAFIPMLLIIITYLILPYGMEAMRQFSVIMQELSGI